MDADDTVSTLKEGLLSDESGRPQQREKTEHVDAASHADDENSCRLVCFIGRPFHRVKTFVEEVGHRECNKDDSCGVQTLTLRSEFIRCILPLASHVNQNVKDECKLVILTQNDLMGDKGQAEGQVSAKDEVDLES